MLESITAFDAIAVAVIVISAIMAFARGFLREIATLGSFIAALAAALWSIDPSLFGLPNVDGDGQDPLSLPGSVLRLEGWLYAPIATVKTGAVAATPPSQ